MFKVELCDTNCMVLSGRKLVVWCVFTSKLRRYNYLIWLNVICFSHCQDYVVNVTEEFLEFISEGALAIEVWGHRCTGNGSSVWEVDSLHAKTRTLRDRYK